MNESFLKKNIKLLDEFDEYMVKYPNLFEEIPDKSYILVTVQNDHAFNAQSMKIIRDKRRKTVVETHKSGKSWSVRPLQKSPA